MHELALAMNVVRIVDERAALADILSVHVVHMDVGALTCVESRALALGFEAAKRGTAAEHAKLEIHPCAARARCDVCAGEPFEIESHFEPCPVCGNFALDIVTGMELRVTELEVD